MPKFNSYQEAVEYRNETLADEYYNEEEEIEEEDEDMDELYDTMIDDELTFGREEK